MRKWIRKIVSDKQSTIATDYFTIATSWADDFTARIMTKCTRYQWACLGLAIVLCLLLVCVMVLVPLQHTQLVVVHDTPGGYSWVSTASAGSPPGFSEPKVKSELAQYVMMREMYDPVVYGFQSKRVGWFSSGQVYAQYLLQQSSQHQEAPIHQLGAKGYRAVTVNSVVLLQKASQDANTGNKQPNLAQVNFMLRDFLFGQEQPLSNTPYTALVSWEYQQRSSKPQELLFNWDGLTITKYVAQPVNIGQ